MSIIYGKIERKQICQSDFSRRFLFLSLLEGLSQIIARISLREVGSIEIIPVSDVSWSVSLNEILNHLDSIRGEESDDFVSCEELEIIHPIDMKRSPSSFVIGFLEILVSIKGYGSPCSLIPDISFMRISSSSIDNAIFSL